MDLYQHVLKAFFTQTNEEKLSKIYGLQKQIDRNKARIDKAMHMMLDEQMEPYEYKAIKSNFDMENTTLLQERASLETDKVDYSSKTSGSFNLLKHLDKFYDEASVEVKQKIVGLNFLKN